MRPLVTRVRRLDYERRRVARNVRYRHFGRAREPRDDIAATLLRDGVVCLREWLDPALLSMVRQELESCLRSPGALQPVRDDAARAPGELDPPATLLEPREIEAGPDQYRARTNAVSVSEPLVRCPTTVRVALDERNIVLATAYFQCPAAVSGVDLRWSFANDLPPYGDHFFFHSDPNSPRILKFLCYLNDVDAEGGPFVYVRGSQRDRFRGWTSKYLWTRDELARQYGDDRIVECTARVGDVVIADTTGFHSGVKTRARDRGILIVNYVIHEEFDGRHPWLEVPAAALDDLSERQRRAVDLLRVVGS
jgi:hypothetical protein